jgi:hypothetical protein
LRRWVPRVTVPSSREARMLVEKATIVRIIKDYTDALAAPRSAHSPVERAYDPVEILRALEEACERAGVSMGDYEVALREDSSLADLESQSLATKVVESPDPGPNDAISRESPTGQPVEGEERPAW